MKRNKIETQWALKFKSSILILPLGILLSLPFVGCSVFMPKGEYKAPQLSKSELATIQIDTERGWLQRYNLIVFRIDGKLALRENIKTDGKIAIDEILVVPGKHDMSVTTIHRSFVDKSIGRTLQTVSWFSADLSAGGTYLLQDDNKLVDASTDKVISQSKLFGSDFGF